MILAYLIANIFCFQLKKSFTFKTSLNKEITLTSPKKFINENKNIVRIIQNHLFGTRNDNKEQGWYYVHFTDNKYLNILRNINSKDEISKDTFVLYLTNDQFNQIANISLVKKIEPSDKIYEIGGSIDEAENLFVSVFHNYQLSNQGGLFSIENKNQDSYILKFKTENLSKKDALKRKMQAIKYLSEIPEIKSISTYKKPTAKNSLATGFTQRNSFDFEQNKNWGFYSLERYMNNRGLKGENQVITVMDTILDFTHGMFRDDEVPIEFNKTMPNHRKIVYYKYHGNMNDWKKEIENNEHGTHVAGTVAGKSSCPNIDPIINDFDGNAPEAKILYPDDYNHFDDDVGTLMEKHNSRISSNSWGSTDYNPYSNQMIGEFAYKNPNIVFIAAAGNEYEVLNGNFSVCDPGGSKNALAVGAIDNFYQYDGLIYFVQVFGTNMSFSIAAIKSFDLYVEGKIGTEKGKCDFLAVNLSKGKQCNLIEPAGIYLFYGDLSQNWYTSCKINHDSQLFYINDDSLTELLKVDKKVAIYNYNIIDEEKKIKRASFSSTGPGFKGILKPDVMAPGSRIISAKSLQNNDSPHGCDSNIYNNLILMDGTSMATPNIGGAMALIHQYFNSGKWIEKVNIDGSTSRALMINSCKHPHNSKVPDIIFGHGVVDLSTVIPIENDFGVQITRQGKESSSKHSVKEEGHVVSKITVNKTIHKKLQITLSYLDPMMDIESFIPLTRDLDMIVVSPSKKVYLGDHLPNGDTQHASANEKVIINEDEVENGDYTIHIYGGVFADGSLPVNEYQEFAVVASGPIQNGFLEFSDSNECPCDNCDKSRPGYCLCDESKNIGQICQNKIETVNGKHGEFTVGPLQIKRIRFISDKKIKSIRSKSSHPGREATIWGSKKCHLSLGEYESYGETGTSFEATNVDTSHEICVAIFNNNDLDATYIIETSNKKKVNWLLILIIAVPVVVIILIIIIIVICCVKKPCCKKKEINDSSLLNSSLTEFNNNLN